MNTTSAVSYPLFARIKLFMALSRTPHGLLDMAAPALGALLWLGAIPSFQIVALGILTAFAGYTAVYALNDVVDHRVDREKIRKCGLPCSGPDIDSVYARHPLAQGLLSLKEGILWTVAWGSVALIGAYALNPACAIVFIAGCVAEGIYCLMLKVSYTRTAVSGGVKTAGALAAVFAVTPDPSLSFMICLFLWLFFWEVGGQNVPNDWSDLNEDRDLDAVTVPVRFGPEKTAALIFYSLVVAVFFSLLLYWITPAQLNVLYLPGTLAVGIAFLILPALRLRREMTPESAAALFNRSSRYPPAMLAVALVSSLAR